jgi:hypothetical protein
MCRRISGGMWESVGVGGGSGTGGDIVSWVRSSQGFMIWGGEQGVYELGSGQVRWGDTQEAGDDDTPRTPGRIARKCN